MANTSRSAALCVDVCDGGGSTEPDQGRHEREREVAAVRGRDSRGQGERREATARGQRGDSLALPAARRPSLPFDFAVRQAELTGHLFLLD